MTKNAIPYTGYREGYNVILYKGEYDIHQMSEKIEKCNVDRKIATDMASVVLDDGFAVIATVDSKNYAERLLQTLREGGFQSEVLFQE